MTERDDSPAPELGDVEARLRDLRRRKQVRWTMSRETAEMAIAALSMAQDRDRERERRRSAKTRRRRRGKKLL